jgi:hypothetical protein
VEQQGWTLVPEVDQGMERKITTLDDPWDIRNKFLRLKHSEEDALKFLTEIGVWSAVEDRQATKASCGKMLLNGWFGHRMFSGRARLVRFEELWAKQDWWKNLLLDRERLRLELSPPAPTLDAAPWQKSEFAGKATALNTLKLHIDWEQRKRLQADGHITTVVEPQGVVEAFTFAELLVATAHLDLLTKAKIQICQGCGNPFTGRERKFCCWYCGHLQSVRKTRRERKEERAK